MKKIYLFLIVLLTFFSFGFTRVYASDVSVDEIIDNDKVYVTTDDSGTFTLTLKEDGTFTMEAVNGEETMMSISGTYVENGRYYDLYVGGDFLTAVWTNDETKDWDIHTYKKEEVEEEVVYPCSVKVVDSAYGEIIYDIYEGNVGDIVTLTAKPYAFCKVVEVKVNDVVITPNEDGDYQFALVEGENNVTSVFAISQEDMSILAENINNYKKGNLEDIFTMENIRNLVGWVISLFSSVGLMVAVLKSKKIKAQTGDEISISVNEKVVKKVEDIVVETFKPMIQTFNNAILSIEKCVTSLNRCMILAQENTPESRLAILDELTIIKGETKELVEEAKNVIKEQINVEKEHKEEKIKAIQELEEKNNSILVKNEESEIKGRI